MTNTNPKTLFRRHVIERTGLSDYHFDKLIRHDLLAAPIKRGRTDVWRESDVEAWLEQRRTAVRATLAETDPAALATLDAAVQAKLNTPDWEQWLESGIPDPTDEDALQKADSLLDEVCGDLAAARAALALASWTRMQEEQADQMHLLATRAEAEAVA